MPTYGLPYMGSKNGIVKFIYKNLPSGKRLVDLFGGGGAIIHYAILKNQDLIKKYESFYYNDFCYDIYKLFKDCVSGEIKNNPYYNKWISREQFFELKDKEPLIKYCWSFGNKGRSYLFSADIEKEKKDMFNICIINNTDNCEIFKKYPFLKNITGNNANERRLSIRKLMKENIKTYKKNKHLYLQDTNRSLEYFQKNNSLDHLNRLQSLERLERLERLESLESLKRLEIDNISYLDYQYQDGDVVYCDPPYENTEQYNNVVFNSQEFYDWVASRKYKVFFSSYAITDKRFKVVDKTEKVSLLSSQGGGKKITEYIYSNY